jgi:hypothetical protein
LLKRTNFLHEPSFSSNYKPDNVLCQSSEVGDAISYISGLGPKFFGRAECGEMRRWVCAFMFGPSLNEIPLYPVEQVG